MDEKNLKNIYFEKKKGGGYSLLLETTKQDPSK